MSALAIIEENPGLAIGAAVVGVLLLTMRGGSSGNSQAMINAQLQAQKTAGTTDIALSSINAQAATARSGQIADVYKTQITSGAQLASVKDTNSAKIQVGLYDYRAKSEAIATQKEVQNNAITANHADTAHALDNQMAMNVNYHSAERYALDTASINLPAIINYQESMKLQDNQKSVTVSQNNNQTLQAIAAMNNDTAQRKNQLASGTAIQLGDFNTEAARKNADTAQSKQSNDNSQSWVKMVASWFGL